MTESKKVSIIVPIYNVEQYIERCVNSVMNQDYKNIEIICVDDGSKDQSGKIIDKIAANNNVIKVIHQENKGVSAARNEGIINATGAYIMFVDGDDWVERDYVSYFLTLVENNHCKVAMNMSNFTDESEQSSNVSGSLNETITAEKAIEWIYNDKIFVAVWNKIYDARLLKENALMFSSDIWYGEGMLFNIDYLQHVDCVAIGNKNVYHQTFNPDSAMRSFNLYSNYCGISSMWLQRAHCKKWNRSIEMEWLYHRYRFNRSILDGIVRIHAEKQYKSAIKECIQMLRRDLILALRKSRGMKQKLSWICYSIFPVRMARRSARKFENVIRKMGGVLRKVLIPEACSPIRTIGGLC